MTSDAENFHFNHGKIIQREISRVKFDSLLNFVFEMNHLWGMSLEKKYEG